MHKYKIKNAYLKIAVILVLTTFMLVSCTIPSAVSRGDAVNSNQVTIINSIVEKTIAMGNSRWEYTAYTTDANSSWEKHNLKNFGSYNKRPVLLTDVRSLNEEAPIDVRFQNVTETDYDIKVYEEDSLEKKDTSHVYEHLSMLEIEKISDNKITDANGKVIGEFFSIESKKDSSNWRTYNLSNTYVEPVVFGTISTMGDGTPCHVARTECSRPNNWR